MDPHHLNAREPPGRPGIELLVACVGVAVALCVWGTIGWRHAYRAEAEANQLRWSEQLREAQLLGIMVRGSEASARMTLEGVSELPQVENGCDPRERERL
jgi:hypothetical protein